MSNRGVLLVTGVMVLMLRGAPAVLAHCDTLDGPVVTVARQALEDGNLDPVLKWVKAEYEPEVRVAFEKTRSVRESGGLARELADLYFLETVVRVHRLGEGASYTGLKPAGTDPGTAVTAADQALQTGEVEGLTRLVTDAVADGIRERFAEAHRAQRTAEHSVADGRAFVAAYVEFVHYAEGLYARATHRGEHGSAEPGAAPAHRHDECGAPGNSKPLENPSTGAAAQSHKCTR